MQSAMVDQGSGQPVVLIPGIQGRWEWMGPAIRALSARQRVLTFSLGDVDRASSAAGLFDRWMARIDDLLDRAGVPAAAIAGVSFGGLIAVHYAAHRPNRVSSLVLVSTPSPRWSPSDADARYLRHPRLAVPAFAARAVVRLMPEILAAKPTWRERARFGLEYAGRSLRAPISPSSMAHWIRQWMATDIAADCRAIDSPTLLVTGEAHLDRVVPVASTLDYLQMVRGARHAVLRGTGHVGLVSKPADFAQLISQFVEVAYPRAS